MLQAALANQHFPEQKNDYWQNSVILLVDIAAAEQLAQHALGCLDIIRWYSAVNYTSSNSDERSKLVVL